MAESSESYGKELAREAGKTAVRAATTVVVGSFVVGCIGFVLTGGNPAGAAAGAKIGAGLGAGFGGDGGFSS